MTTLELTNQVNPTELVNLPASDAVTAKALRSAQLELAEREGLKLISSNDLAELSKSVAIYGNMNKGADLAEIESKAVMILALIFAKYGTDNRTIAIRAAVKKAANRVASSTQSGRVRGPKPTQASAYTMGELANQTQLDAVKASIQSSNLLPVERGYAHKGKTFRLDGNARGAEGTAWGQFNREVTSHVLNFVLGAELVDALHDNHVEETRATRNGKLHARGEVIKHSRIEWSKVAELVDGNPPRGTLHYMVQKATNEGLAMIRSASI